MEAEKNVEKEPAAELTSQELEQVAAAGDNRLGGAGTHFYECPYCGWKPDKPLRPEVAVDEHRSTHHSCPYTPRQIGQ